MNKARRKEIERLTKLLEQAKEEVEAVEMDERGSWENLPEGLQESEMAERMEEAADWLTEAMDAIEQAVDAFEEADFRAHELNGDLAEKTFPLYVGGKDMNWEKQQQARAMCSDAAKQTVKAYRAMLEASLSFHYYDRLEELERQRMKRAGETES